jgi:hypothetical protein
VLVFVPIGLDLAATPDRDGRNHALYRFARFAQPFAALAAVVAFFVPVGLPAGLCAAPWFLLCAVVGLGVLPRLGIVGMRRLPENAISVALLYLPIGGAWFLAERSGLAPLRFGGVIAFLTAIHFHFAGFIAPLIIGMIGRSIPATAAWARRLYAVAAPGVIAGPPLVALGITFSSGLEVVSASVLAFCITLAAVVAIGPVASAVADRRARLLLRVGSVASVAAMLLALAYAISTALSATLISIPTMAISHGVLNALFAFCGLLAWSIVRPAAR